MIFGFVRKESARQMFDIIARLVFGLVVIVVMTLGLGLRLDARAACSSAPVPHLVQASPEGQGAVADTNTSVRIAHHGHDPMPGPCKHGCTALLALLPPLVVTDVSEPRLAVPDTAAHLSPSRPTAPDERPPKYLA